MWGSRRPPRLVLPFFLHGQIYDLGRAKAAHETMGMFTSVGLRKELQTSGKVLMLPYPGIGVPPPRPGGDLMFVGRCDMEFLVKGFLRFARSGGRGHTLYLTGAKGLGKSCLLRGLAWLVMCAAKENGQKFRVVGLWNMEATYKNLLLEVIAALRFAYCCEDDMLQEIGQLESVADVAGFMDKRMALGESFFFMVDGMEVLETIDSQGNPRRDKDARAEVEERLASLLQKSRATIKAVSPLAQMQSRKRKASDGWLYINDGFAKEEYDAYGERVAILGMLPWKDDIKHYAAGHPLSLSVLDACCKQRASEVLAGDQETEGLPLDEDSVPNSDVVGLLGDKDEWNQVLDLFVSSTEMESIRAGLARTLSSVSAPRHTKQSMMLMDMSFVLGDPDDASTSAAYATPYIERMYIEGFREAENVKVYDNSAWQHYCKYLLDLGGSINWVEVGWLVERLMGELICSKGLVLDGFSIRNVQWQRFATVPSYSSWIDQVQRGHATYFIPMQYNYRSIDGLLAWQDVSERLHAFAIQVTVRDAKHRATAGDFMSYNNIVKWIPEKELEKWELHYVFLCLRSLLSKSVPKDLKPLKNGGYYGTVRHMLHTVSFTDAFQGSVGDLVLKTMKDVIQARDDASKPVAEEEARKEMEAINDAVAAIGPASTSKAGELIRTILSRREFTRPVLGNIAKHHKIAVSSSDRKAELIAKVASGVLEI